MKILLSGGGTGGHITPLLAVARELKKRYPNVKTIYVGERGGEFAHMVAGTEEIDEVRSVWAGKFRRYHGESWVSRLLDWKTNLLNIRDMFLIAVGMVQAWLLVRSIKPDAVFLKGGFVGVPVGLAAAFWRVPYVTHDSDALPGLANRIVAPWAALHATALPAEFYMYPKEHTRSVGVLVGERFERITPELQMQYKRELGIPEDSPVLFVTGGSLGAVRLNEPVADIVPELLKSFPKLYIIHQTGKHSRRLYDEHRDKRLIALEFIKDMHRYTGAADIVVARAGATTLAELGVQGKACIVVPNKQLTGGHQTKNADRLAQEKAVLVVKETTRKKDAAQLKKAISALLRDPQQRAQLGSKLHDIYPPHAAKKLAVLLLEDVAGLRSKGRRRNTRRKNVEKTTKTK